MNPLGIQFEIRRVRIAAALKGCFFNITIRNQIPLSRESFTMFKYSHTCTDYCWSRKQLPLGIEITELRCSEERGIEIMKVIGIIITMIGILIISAICGPIHEGNALEAYKVKESYTEVAPTPTPAPDQLIRFHVIANSDTEQDQALKRAVRDAILKEVSPRLAVSQSLDESRQIIKKVRSDMENTGRSVVKAWGKDYTVHTEYGHFSFPTKSYGSLVLPAGTYEALRVVIGAGQGSNWWCVLFPPLCFIDIEHSTAVQVDGKPGIPIKNESTVNSIKQKAKPTVRFYFWEMINRILNHD
jgi:stage II sporulation protein R